METIKLILNHDIRVNNGRIFLLRKLIEIKRPYLVELVNPSKGYSLIKIDREFYLYNKKFFDSCGWKEFIF